MLPMTVIHRLIAQHRFPRRPALVAPARLYGIAAISLLLAGCQRPVREPLPQRPDVAPAEAHTDAQPLRLDASQIKPMYTELLPIDLPAVVQVAAARNFDIRQARTSVEASLGEYESTVGGAFPAIVPTALFEQAEGTFRATRGNLVGVGFNSFTPSIAIQWVINPGRVINDIIAAKKRLHATEDLEQAVIQDTLRRAVVQYYALAFTQAAVSAAHQGVIEAEELLRITRIRVRTGTGVPADELRAEARLAEQRQDMVSSLQTFYNASVNLTLTLHLDSAVTLVPRVTELRPTELVRANLEIEELLSIAVTFRPDLESVRRLVEAAAARTGSTWWGGFGPEFALGFRYGWIKQNANNVDRGRGIPPNLILNPASPTGEFSSNPFVNGLIREGINRDSRGRDDISTGYQSQQFGNASLGWRLSLATFGDLKTAKAFEEQALIRAERLLALVGAEVVTAAQSSQTQDQLVSLAHQQVASAEEALRLTEANLRAGTMTTLDVLQALDAATEARLRHARAVVAYNQSQVNLLASIGLLSEDALTPQENG